MLTHRFTWLIVFRVLLLTAVLGILAWIWGDARLFFTQLILVLCIAGIVAELIRFINVSNREVARFLFAIRHGDLSATFKYRALGPSFDVLHQQMTELADAYKHVKIEKEAQFQLLQALVDRISVGIIFLVEGNVALINGTAQKLLNVGASQDWKLIRHRNALFAQELQELGDQGRKLIEIPTKSGSRMISTDVTTLLILGKSSKLITLQDINAEIEQKEYRDGGVGDPKPRLRRDELSRDEEADDQHVERQQQALEAHRRLRVAKIKRPHAGAEARLHEL